MSKRSKRYQQAAELVEEDKQYGLEDAVGIIKKFPAPKFDPTVTLSFKLGVDPVKANRWCVDLWLFRTAPAKSQGRRFRHR